MIFREEIDVISNKKKAFAVPIIIDLIGLIIAILFFKYKTISVLSIRPAISIGLPSINTVLHPVNQFLTYNYGDDLQVALLFVAIIWFFVGAFIQAGYLCYLVDEFTTRSADFATFIQAGRHFFLRFLLVGLITVPLSFVIGLIIVLFNTFGIILGFVLLLVLRIIFIYWEITIVSDDVGVISALFISREYFRKRVPETINVIVFILLMNMGFSLVINYIPFIPVYTIGIILYGYCASVLNGTLFLSLDLIKTCN